MALRKIKGERRDGFVNLRMPEELMLKLNILAFLDNKSGADTVLQAIEELIARNEVRINLVREAVNKANLVVAETTNDH